MTPARTIGSVFSGIGSLELGLERAGVGRVAWQVEIDPWCRSVLEKHWPNVTRYEDVTTLDWSTVEPVDVLCGGFPCQPVSQNGHQLVVDDDRWLWPEFARAIRSLRPRYVVIENVADLAVRGLDIVLAGLASLGFDAEWQVLPAAAVGAPHRRERMFVVAYPDSLRRQAGERLLTGDTRQSLGESPWGGVPIRGASGRLRPGPPPGVLRVADGPATELDLARLRALGNSVVPQVAELIGRRLLEVAS